VSFKKYIWQTAQQMNKHLSFANKLLSFANKYLSFANKCLSFANTQTIVITAVLLCK